MKKHDNTNMVLRYLLGFENTEKRFENLVEFLTKTGIHRVILFTAPFVETSSILPIDYYKRHSQMLAPYIKKLRELNIEVGINSLFTVGHCYYADETEFGFKRAVTVNGEASRGCVCMHADGFDEYLKEKDINIRYFENEFSVSLSPYEIKTVKINGNSLIDVYITED